MKQGFLFIITLLVFAGLCNAQKINTLSKKEKKAGWELLFSGKNMEGWKFFQGEEVNKGWNVVEGIMNNSGIGSDHGGDIITTREFKDFELYLEWKIDPEIKSGVFYRVQEGDTRKIYETAPEYRLIDDKDLPGKLDKGQYSGANYAMHEPVGSRGLTQFRNIKVREL